MQFHFLFQLTWFKNGQRIRESQRVEMSHSNQQATLRIRVALPEDSGHYTLLSENPQGCTVSSAYLAIESSDQVDQAYQAPRETIKTQQVETTGESDSGKVLPPNFVRTCTDRDATEGKMTRYVSRILSNCSILRKIIIIFWNVKNLTTMVEKYVCDSWRSRIFIIFYGSFSLLLLLLSVFLQLKNLAAYVKIRAIKVDTIFVSFHTFHLVLQEKCYPSNRNLKS